MEGAGPRRKAGLLALCACFSALALAAPGAAQAAKDRAPRSPNILVVVTDDQRADGTLAAMPRTRKVFSQSSTRYPNTHVSTPLCCPSRSTIFSGLYAHNHGVWHHDGHFADDRKTFQHWLQNAGYTTALVGKYLNLWPHLARPRFWNRFAINEGAHSDSIWNVNGHSRRVGGSSTRFARQQATRFIRGMEARDRRPWMLYVASSEPHGPLTPPRRYLSRSFGGFRQTPAMAEEDLSDKPRFLREQAPNLRAMGPNPAEVRLAQLRLLQSVDELVGSLDRELRRAGEDEDTLVLFTSDNGLHWGEHGGLITKDLPYDASTHVPLMIRWPASVGRRPAVDRRLVSNVDIAPTLLDVAGAKGHKPDGRSLRNRGWRRDFLLLEHAGFRSPAVVIPPWIALRDRRHLYVEWGPGVPWGEQSPAYPPEAEYYQVRRDPWELQSTPEAAPPGLSVAVRDAFRCRGARNCP